MSETFLHPHKLKTDHVKYTWLRLLLWSFIGIPFWTFGILMVLRNNGYAGIAFAAFFTVVKAGFEIFFHVASREILRLADHKLVHESGKLRQETPDGETVATIDLDQPFSVDFYFNPIGQPIYRVTQSEHVVKFAARLNGAERLVIDVLRKPDKWPPEVPETESAARRYHRRAEPGEDA